MPLYLGGKVERSLLSSIKYSLTLSAGAASDKVAALEKAGAIVTDSPAKIGPEMLKVSQNKLFTFGGSHIYHDFGRQ